MMRRWQRRFIAAGACTFSVLLVEVALNPDSIPISWTAAAVMSAAVLACQWIDEHRGAERGGDR
jgi:hypothetical protein